MEKKIVAVVPVKLNNERLPGKNTKTFDNGEPLIHYILTTLAKVKRCDAVYVYCSDERIKEYLPENIRFVQRDTALDSPHCNSMDISKTFCQFVDADIYIYTHATAPFITAESIDKGLDALLNKGHDSAFAVTENHAFLWVNGQPNYDLACLPRTQDMQAFYVESCGFWLYTKDLILKHGRRIGFNPAMIPVSTIEALDIDERVDFDIANAVYNYIVSPKLKNDPPPRIVLFKYRSGRRIRRSFGSSFFSVRRTA
jgi:CMP-N-acetylneuraminic acid synthetase